MAQFTRTETDDTVREVAKLGRQGDKPREGNLYVGTPLTSSVQVGFTIVNGTYVTIQASSCDLLLQAVRSLKPPTHEP